MSKNQKPQKCRCKVAYKTPFDAAVAIDKYWRQYKKYSRMYECLFCGLIHLTTKVAKPQGEI
jgi:hypothetical protein